MDFGYHHHFYSHDRMGLRITAPVALPGKGYRTAGATADGYFTFLAAGILGIFIFYRTIIPVNGAYQSLMPLFVGLFAIPAI